MRLLVVSDIHGNGDALDKCRDEAATADILLCVGDLTHFGGVTEARKILDKLRTLHPLVRSVAGNCDNREIESYLQEEGVLLTSKTEEIQGARFVGLSGAMPGPIDTPYEISEDQIETFLEQLPADATQPLMLVCHQPPYNTVADRAMKMKHVGSHRLSEWIKARQPLVVLSGHIHESFGHKVYGHSHIINPGALKEGRYAMVDVELERNEVSAVLKA
ncbi:MAG: metallophosphoesterase family protein [Spirochaetaceae bacterium]|nr:metallophosphoesterase family protein [Spirochaetaceae bacterium]MCF7947005.1 metallophosphoesterase family protein [Spirochaetia bacterium]MCF7950212.1 metallophosphoesterase family protein [Spirochaetaceae bacterium]